MEEEIVIQLMYKGQAYDFDARLIMIGYTHKYIVNINNALVTYEPGDNRKYEVIVVEAPHGGTARVDKDLICAVGEQIKEYNK